MYITIKELSEELKVHPNTIRNQIKKGMPCIKTGRPYKFILQDVINWYKEKT